LVQQRQEVLDTTNKNPEAVAQELEAIVRGHAAKVPSERCACGRMVVSAVADAEPDSSQVIDSQVLEGDIEGDYVLVP
jgi:hypothetical protein